MPNGSKADFAVFIGRFQPFHTGHKRVLTTALKAARHVIVLVGSARARRGVRNPFSFEERSNMIMREVGGLDAGRVHVTPLLDYLYRDQEWIEAVQASVQGIVAQYSIKPPRQSSIALIGHQKDFTGYYLKLFPQWSAIDSGHIGMLSATPIREEYFSLPLGDMEALQVFLADNAKTLPSATQGIMYDFFGMEEFDTIAADLKFAREYKKQWASAPYPPTFVTVDAVVFQAAHVLMIRRGMMPGKGALALPGGFINQGETLRDAMVRELREETRLEIPPAVLQRAIGPMVFDDPHRSIRGRTITHAYGIHLKEEARGLAKVKGGDDAKKALWVPIAELDQSEIFEDHYHIIRSVMQSLHDA